MAKAGILAATICAALTGYLFYCKAADSSENLKRIFEVEATRCSLKIQQRFEQYINDLMNVKRFYECSQDISADEFAGFVDPILQRNPGMQIIVWIPADYRQSIFEYGTNAGDFRNIGPEENDHGGQPYQMTSQKIHFPVRYIYPFKNQELLGCDLATVENKYDAFEKAWMQDTLTATMPTVINKKISEPGSFVVYAPVYNLDGIICTANGRKENLKGFIGAYFDVKQLLSYAIPQELAGIDVEIHGPFHISARICEQYPQTNERLYRLLPRNQKPVYKKTFAVADQHVEIAATPLENFIAQNQNINYWLIPPLGAIIAILTTLYLNDIQNRRQKAEKMVEQRTSELRCEKEKADRMAQQAQAASRAKSEFVANMSHEIRTPMNAILGFADILAEEEMTDQQQQYVSIIKNSGQSLLTLINDILDLSKIEAGKLVIEMTDCCLDKIANHLRTLLGQQAANKNIDFDVTLDKTLPAVIHSDPVRLQQCLINLAGNAIKFTEKGHVNIRITRGGNDNEPVIDIEVEDTGIGIPKERQQAIFTAFTQADNTTTRKYGGTGLGLTITRRLVELLGGKLLVESEQGKGSLFNIVLPMGVDINAAKTIEDLEREKNEAVGGEQAYRFCGKALVAEDSPSGQKLIHLLLSNAGLTVKMVENGKDAVDETMKNQYDLIVMDIRMPIMNGLTAVKKMREQGVATTIIAITANVIKGDREDCLKAGCDDYLPKPINQKKLMEMLKKYLTAEKIGKEKHTVLS